MDFAIGHIPMLFHGFRAHLKLRQISFGFHLVGFNHESPRKVITFFISGSVGLSITLDVGYTKAKVTQTKYACFNWA